MNPLPSPERIKDGSCGHNRDFALLQSLAGWGRVGIRWVRELRTLGRVVAQESFLPIAVVRSLHPSPVTFKDAITLRHLIRRGNEDAYKLSLAVVGKRGLTSRSLNGRKEV